MAPNQRLKITEGTIPFHHASLPPDKQCVTWYRIVGDFKAGVRPLVTLHGGPGASHAYLKPLFDPLSSERPVVYYDQLGTGQSTHLRERRLDTSFWTTELFMVELDNVVAHLLPGGIEAEFDLYGHSWGAMLAGAYATWPFRRTKGLRKLILASGPASMKLWSQSCRTLLRQLPEETQRTIEKYEEAKDYNNDEYKSAVMEFYNKFLCRLDVWPDELNEGLSWLEKDDTVYFTMNGPSELTVVGNLKTYDMIDKAKAILQPTLIINGEYDEAQDVCIAPWFWSIPKAKWFAFADGSHMVHLEQPAKYAALVSEFLNY